jgi:hypothetical protein
MMIPYSKKIIVLKSHPRQWFADPDPHPHSMIRVKKVDPDPNPDGLGRSQWRRRG